MSDLTTIDPMWFVLLRAMIAEGVIIRHEITHDFLLRGCDGQQTCGCPDPNYSYRLAGPYAAIVESNRG